MLDFEGFDNVQVIFYECWAKHCRNINRQRVTNLRPDWRCRDPHRTVYGSLVVTLAPTEDDDSQPVCNADLDELFILLPRLAEVRISICTEVEDNGGFHPQPAKFLKTLATTTTLLPNLELLSIDWDFSAWEYGSAKSTRGNEPDAPDSAQIPDFAALRDALIAKGPTLTTLHLDGYHFLFHWCGSSTNGTAKEATATDWGKCTRTESSRLLKGANRGRGGLAPRQDRSLFFTCMKTPAGSRCAWGRNIRQTCEFIEALLSSQGDKLLVEPGQTPHPDQVTAEELTIDFTGNNLAPLTDIVKMVCND
ncbi:hypothetical protein B0H13DRAFT_1887156 [Mycena leptocephala]|nr:hypothetical protein B0H13DRAFT_1887156 [Mycena leptocephala]